MKIAFPSMAAQSVENQDVLELPEATALADDAIAVVVEDPFSSTPRVRLASMLTMAGGGRNNSNGSGPPPPPPDVNSPAFYVDEDTDSLYYWKYKTVVTPRWVPLILTP